jgi:hypothetical protein
VVNQKYQGFLLDYFLLVAFYPAAAAFLLLLRADVAGFGLTVDGPFPVKWRVLLVLLRAIWGQRIHTSKTGNSNITAITAITATGITTRN